VNPPTEARRPDRDLRQREIVPPERLAACHAVVIGVGAIGRQVALQLAAVGVPQLTLFDDDRVGFENLAPQGYWEEDVGAYKVQRTADVCRRINWQTRVIPVAARYRRSSARELSHDRLVVFSCVDSIATRRLIWESLRSRAALFLDGRMSAEVIRVLAAEWPATQGYYATTLFGPEEAYAGACTARSTIYASSVAAGLMVGQFTRWLRRLPVDLDLSLNLLSMELAVTPGLPA
jgi:sulfur carrier protein ThiS adenylyltransferase